MYEKDELYLLHFKSFKGQLANGDWTLQTLMFKAKYF